MERLWPPERKSPIFQFYKAQNIEDMVNSRGEVVGYTLGRFLEHHRETGELSFMIHRDNLWERALCAYGELFSFPLHLPYILLDRNQNFAFYKLTETYIFLPRVRHTKEKDKEVKGGRIELFDNSGQVEVSFPDRIYLNILRKHGKPMDTTSLRENDWQSDVILRCSYKSNGDQYILFDVFNRWAQEHQQETIRQFIAKHVPQSAG